MGYCFARAVSDRPFGRHSSVLLLLLLRLSSLSISCCCSSSVGGDGTEVTLALVILVALKLRWPLIFLLLNGCASAAAAAAPVFGLSWGTTKKVGLSSARLRVVYEWRIGRYDVHVVLGFH